jgi:hypothetical protein
LGHWLFVLDGLFVKLEDIVYFSLVFGLLLHRLFFPLETVLPLELLCLLLKAGIVRLLDIDGFVLLLRLLPPPHNLLSLAFSGLVVVADLLFNVKLNLPDLLRLQLRQVEAQVIRTDLLKRLLLDYLHDAHVLLLGHRPDELRNVQDFLLVVVLLVSLLLAIVEVAGLFDFGDLAGDLVDALLDIV